MPSERKRRQNFILEIEANGERYSIRASSIAVRLIAVGPDGVHHDTTGTIRGILRPDMSLDIRCGLATLSGVETKLQHVEHINPVINPADYLTLSDSEIATLERNRRSYARNGRTRKAVAQKAPVVFSGLHGGVDGQIRTGDSDDGGAVERKS